mmetsp:Transcript_3763/g.8023  ORF Transcript_3763/g.8023 Transcript_3763/m.8023 type:complete len:141 (+) Transcript_3763:22-444(+)
MDCKCGNQGKYRCPLCKEERYCSIECYKAHKAQGCKPHFPKRFRLEVKQPPRNYLLEDEDDIILRQVDLARLRSNKVLRQYLKNTELRELIMKVDSSSNRLGALKSVLAQDPKGESLFKKTIDEMLKSVSVLSQEGQLQV